MPLKAKKQQLTASLAADKDTSVENGVADSSNMTEVIFSPNFLWQQFI